jgi:hypothetical protein
MSVLCAIFHHLQRQLFPALADEMGALSALDQQFCEVVALTDLGRFTRRYAWCGNGAPPCPRTWLAHAFLAKTVYQFPTTAALLDALKSRPTLRRLCGWESAGDIPSEPTFSRAFTEFAHDQLPQQIHAHMVQTHAGPKLVGHVSRDATAIEAPERPAPKPAAAPTPPRPRGRPKKGEVRPAPPLKRLEGSRLARWPRTWRTCPLAATWAASAIAKAIRKVGLVTNSTSTRWTAMCR